MAEITLRRATIEDLPRLRPLWEKAGMPVHDLEKRFTEFQIATETDGQILGALALRVQPRDGLLHTETWSEPGRATLLLPQLWDRILGVAKNHGLFRLWTLSPAPFWAEAGLAAPPPEIRAKLPVAFGPADAPWRYLQIRDESAEVVSLDKEFELFQQATKDSTERVFEQARQLKTIAWIVLGLFFLGVVLIGLAIANRRFLPEP